jgi:hypothetical protein
MSNPFPPFRVRKELKADRVQATDIETTNYRIPLVFAGPHASSVTASLTRYSDLWALTIPVFSGAASGSPSALFTVQLPSWVPVPTDALACQGVPVLSAAAPAAGYVAVSSGGTLSVNILTGNFAGSCGLLGDVTIQYAVGLND